MLRPKRQYPRERYLYRRAVILEIQISLLTSAEHPISEVRSNQVIPEAAPLGPWIARGAVLVLIAAAMAALWAFAVEPASLVVREYDVELPAWPQSADDLHIAILGDLHVGSPFNGLDKLQRIVQETNNTKPDLVLLAGDYVIQGVLGGSFVPPQDFAPVVAGLQVRLGVWAVLGNHDWWLDGPAVRTALEQNGIRVLDNEAAALDATGELWLAGVGDYKEGSPDVSLALRTIPDTATVIVLTHNPDVFPEIPDRVALSIAGHTHGGQVRLPLLGRPIVPSRFGERYAAGVITEGSKHFFVSTGLGTSILPIRFRVPPEISLLRIRAR